MSSPILAPEALKPRLGAKDLVLLDARAGGDARARYLAKHLPGALFVSGDDDLAARPLDAKDGGRHPLPSARAFAETLGRLGVTPASEVVIYDDKAGANPASRAWWMVRALGHEKVSVLDGGLAAAIDAGFLTAFGNASPIAAPPYPATEWRSPTLAIEQVEAAIREGTRLVVDARDGVRHRGESEPFDPVAGHIPGTINAPQSALLGTDGRFLPAEALRARFDALLAGRAPTDVVAYCGSGVTACHLLLGMEQAGLPGAALYVGSFSEWCRSGRPIATGAS
jgi:thiosulfate/3-mercaptopyruvate sulfurtransferase